VVQPVRNPRNMSFLATRWQMAFERVLEETDTHDLFWRVEIAEAAMFLRYEVIAYGSEHGRERRILRRALLQLRLLKNERLGFPV
jgi:hypothetical protein